MAFWSKWFSSALAGQAAAVQSLDYKGFHIEARPFKEGGQWQLAGRISKDGKQHDFIRADKFSDKDECAAIAISKGQLIVDQSGDRIFS
ncbi:MAG: HlyU family transcriptional regulator [Hyphomicrobiales bacterium]